MPDEPDTFTVVHRRLFGVEVRRQTIRVATGPDARALAADLATHGHPDARPVPCQRTRVVVTRPDTPESAHLIDTPWEPMT